MLVHLLDEVAEALSLRRAVVALESTILAHGLPWPENLEIGRALEREVRSAGAIPATVAVVDGAALVGLPPATLEKVARDGGAFRKLGAADLAVALALGRSGATTVSATVALAAQAGIKVMATGGIGGVHRGHQGDVSSDLTLLAQTPVVVVSAGAKAILDLHRTAEMLESLGILVVGYRTGELPAFYTPWSGIALEHRIETPAEAARVAEMRFALGQGGVLVCNPIPEGAALDPREIDGIIAAALERADREGITGKAVTPFLLGELAQRTGGAAVAANRALALANARLAGEIAVEMCEASRHARP
jgi:pseudouridylate synthase